MVFCDFIRLTVFIDFMFFKEKTVDDIYTLFGILIPFNIKELTLAVLEAGYPDYICISTGF